MDKLKIYVNPKDALTPKFAQTIWYGPTRLTKMAPHPKFTLTYAVTLILYGPIRLTKLDPHPKFSPSLSADRYVKYTFTKSEIFDHAESLRS